MTGVLIGLSPLTRRTCATTLYDPHMPYLDDFLEDIEHIPRLKQASCLGVEDFTSDMLSSSEARMLIGVCSRCPVLDVCRSVRDDFRRGSPADWGQFTGVWAGVAFTHGRPRKVRHNWEVGDGVR